MSWTVNDQEFESVLAETPEKQFGYFVGKVADWAEVWLLRRGDTELARVEGEAEDDEGVAAWAHERYARACIKGEWSDYEAVAMEVHEFVDGLLAQLDEKGISVAVMHTPDGQNVWTPAQHVRAALEEELARIE